MGWLQVEQGRSDDNGNFSIGTTYTKEVWYNVKFKGTYAKVKEGDIFDMANGKIKIEVNSQIFTAKLLNYNSIKVFKKILSLTINMVELNDNEKHYDFPNDLSANSSNPRTIRNGI